MMSGTHTGPSTCNITLVLASGPVFTALPLLLPVPRKRGVEFFRLRLSMYRNRVAAMRIESREYRSEGSRAVVLLLGAIEAIGQFA